MHVLLVNHVCDHNAGYLQKIKRPTDHSMAIMDILNLNKKDAFDEAFISLGQQLEKVHIRIQNRNKKKCITTVQGLANDLDLKKILRALKKTFRCNGAIIKDDTVDPNDPNGSEGIIQLQGNHRAEVVKFLVSEEIVSKEMIIEHGY
jgi:translation initiation factor 1